MKFEEWLAQQDGVIEVECGCVTYLINRAGWVSDDDIPIM